MVVALFIMFDCGSAFWSSCHSPTLVSAFIASAVAEFTCELTTLEEEQEEECEGAEADAVVRGAPKVGVGLEEEEEEGKEDTIGETEAAEEGNESDEAGEED